MPETSPNNALSLNVISTGEMFLQQEHQEWCVWREQVRSIMIRNPVSIHLPIKNHACQSRLVWECCCINRYRYIEFMVKRNLCLPRYFLCRYEQAGGSGSYQQCQVKYCLPFGNGPERMLENKETRSYQWN